MRLDIAFGRDSNLLEIIHRAEQQCRQHLVVDAR